MAHYLNNNNNNNNNNKNDKNEIPFFFLLKYQETLKKVETQKRLIKKKKFNYLYQKYLKLKKKTMFPKNLFFSFFLKKNVLQSTPFQNPGGVP